MAQNGELMDAIDLPIIKDHDSFVELLEKFAMYVLACASSRNLSDAKNHKIYPRFGSVHLFV